MHSHYKPLGKWNIDAVDIILVIIFYSLAEAIPPVCNELCIVQKCLSNSNTNNPLNNEKKKKKQPLQNEL